MVVFSDLDRSIIYSNKFLDNIKEADYECIETKDNKEISYVSLQTIELLKKITENTLFIPTTTRTTEQFRRIDFEKHNINFEYAITCNGGCILKNNKPLEGWLQEIENIKASCEKIEVMLNLFDDYSKIDGVTNFRVAENLFFYIVVDYKNFNINDLNGYIDILDSKNWTFYISGRKIYFLPKDISKENAIQYLCNINEIDKFAVIGDSKMDLGMLNIAENPYLLKHGDVEVNDIKEHFNLSENHGIKGTEEILNNLLQLI